MLTPLEYLLLLLAITWLTFARGDRETRAVALTCVAASVLTALASTAVVRSFAEIEIGILLVDFAALAAFTHVALRSPRFWPLWVAGFQLTSIFSHGLKAIRIGMLPQVYAAAERLWIYPIFAVIVVAVIRHQIRETKRWQRLN